MRDIMNDDFEDRFYELHVELAHIRKKFFDLRERYFDEGGIDDAYKKWELREEPENTKEYQSLRKRYKIVEEQIIELFRKFLNKEIKSDLKKDKIVALKKKFPRAFNYQVARAVNCSYNYACQFWIEPNGSVYYRGRRKTDEKIKKAVLERDNYSCVACGTKDNLEIHHVNAHKDVMNNLVTLCHECHYYVHDGDYTKQTHGPKKFSQWPEHINKAKMECILRPIYGVGPVTTERLYENFGTIENLKKAGIKDLIKIPHINETMTKRIKRCL